MTALGPFDLEALAGRGGMGVVYRARHRVDAHLVAIKLLSGSRVDRTALEREIEATAALTHPGIVAVYDTGLVPDDVGAPDLVPGSPYIVMEYLSGGSLGDHGAGLTWPGLRNALFAVLDALAHAHARGVLHLDLKPANVLRDEAGAWRLADFGISRLVREEGRVMGTPPFMAPELLRGDLGRLGPWTDLYALGVLTWRLLTGSYPRNGSSQELLAHALAGALPPFQPTGATPPGVEEWLRRLLAAGIEERFECAADAAWALSRLPALGADLAELSVSPLDSSATFTLDPVTTSIDVAIAPELPDSGPAVAEFPPVPRLFTRPPHPKAPPSNLGLNLFALRPLPFVGRGDEVDALWDQVLHVCDRGEPRIAAIEGPAGVGKTRLATEVVRRAHEVGATRVIRIDPTSADPVVRLLEQVRAHPPEPGSVAAHAWARWIEGGTVAPGELAALAAGALARASRSRPVLVHIDEADRHAAVPGLVDRIARTEGAVCVLLTGHAVGDVRTDLRLTLEGLETRTLRKLLRAVLGLEPQATLELARQAGGRPRFLAHLLAHLAQRGRLRAGERGYELIEGDPIPPETRALQRARLADWLGPPPSETWAALEVAAVLGPATHLDEVSRAWEAAGVSLDDDALRRGRRLGLLGPLEDHLQFADAELHDAVLSGIPTDDLPIVHGMAAEAVHASAQDRRARHLEASGNLDAAAKAYWEAAADANAVGDLHRAHSLFVEHLRLLRAADAEPEVLARTLGWLGWCNYRMSRFDEAIDQANQTRAIGEALGSPYLVGSGLHTLGVVAAAECRGNASDLLLQASRAYGEAGHQSLETQAWLAAVVYMPADPALLDELEERVARGGPHAESFGLLRRAELLLRLRRLDEAKKVAQHAVQRFQVENLVDRAYATERVLACIHANAGELEDAQRAFERAHRLMIDDTSNLARSSDLLSGLVALRQGDMVRGANTVREQARYFVTHRWLDLLLSARVGQLVLAAWDGDRPAFDDLLARTLKLLEGIQLLPYLDLDPYPELAATVWEERGEPERAAAARELGAALAAKPR